MKIIVALIIGISLYGNWFDYQQGVMKLVSDSEIHIKNGKLQSNSSIYGRFFSNDFLQYTLQTNGIYNINCNLKQNLYNVVDDCRMIITKDNTKYLSKLNPSRSNIVYLGKMQAKNIKRFDNKTHMIECLYSEEYGIMHDCRRKIYHFKFR